VFQQIAAADLQSSAEDEHQVLIVQKHLASGLSQPHPRLNVAVLFTKINPSFTLNYIHQLFKH
jgi:hypothetical protein